ncbi:MAG TPA: hypothetical protein PKG96_10155 [Bacilli bacterium]|jgi:hypothetical protein|nr:hypothetical protein [Bacilli bacterium]HQK63488.1 hypothetical protein [Methanofastidiosum sp.]
MKKLSKLQINPEKLMKNDELLIIRGGYGDGYCCLHHCTSNSQCPCTDCPICDWAAGYPDSKLCLNP